MSTTIDESTSGARGSVSVTVTAEPLTLNIPSDMGAAEANAIAQGIMAKIRAITQMTKSGKHPMFNNTGTLARSIEAVLGANSYDIVGPPGYLQMDETLQKLIDLVPEIADPTLLDELAAAVEQTATAMLTVG